jgi:hypothetical protein
VFTKGAIEGFVRKMTIKRRRKERFNGGEVKTKETLERGGNSYAGIRLDGR